MGRVETVFPIFEIRVDDGGFWEEFPVLWRVGGGKIDRHRRAHENECLGKTTGKIVMERASPPQKKVAE